MAKKFGCYTSLSQKETEPTVIFDTKPEAERWRDNWNSKVFDPASHAFACQVQKRAYIRELDI